MLSRVICDACGGGLLSSSLMAVDPPSDEIFSDAIIAVIGFLSFELQHLVVICVLQRKEKVQFVMEEANATGYDRFKIGKSPLKLSFFSKDKRNLMHFKKPNLAYSIMI